MNRRLLILLVVPLLFAFNKTAAAQSSEALWFVSFWNNPDQEGAPVATSSSGVIDYNWGTGEPTPGVGSDTWSARWTSFVEFEPGTYRFTTRSDDGVRLYVGDKHIINDWNKHPTRTNTVTVSLSGGEYPIALDYFDDVGHAEVRLQWERLGPPVEGSAYVTLLPAAPPQASPQAPSPGPAPAPPLEGVWAATYWANRDLSGDPVLTRTEGAIDHFWGHGSPPGLPADNFSARWTRLVPLPSGRYRFTTISDDGVRVWANDQLIIDNWTDHMAQSNSAEMDWPGGILPLRVEYYEHDGAAQIWFNWQRLGPATGTGGQPLATINTGRLNLRTGPGTQFSIINSYPRDTIVTLHSRDTNTVWVYVTVPDGQQGWMHSGYLATNVNIADLSVLAP